MEEREYEETSDSADDEGTLGKDQWGGVRLERLKAGTGACLSTGQVKRWVFFSVA